MIKEINSKVNARFKLWLSLLESKGIKKEGLALVSGPKIVDEALTAGRVRELILPPKGGDEVLKRAHGLDPKLHTFRLHSDLFRALDVMGTDKPLVTVGTHEIKPWEKTQGLNLIVALSDPANLGACLRTAEAMGVSQIALTRECASPFLPKAIKASSGSVFRLKLASTSALADLKIDAASVIGLDLEGENIYNFVWPRDTVLVVGEEGQGLPASLKTKRLKIPMKASIESLNAVVATSIALFSYRGRHPL